MYLSTNGSCVAIGSPFNGGGGHVRVFEYDSSSWEQLGADIDGEAAGDESGRSVSFSANGGRVAVGVIQNARNECWSCESVRFQLFFVGAAWC